MKTRIYIDQHAIKRNAKRGTNDPPISVRTYKGVGKAHHVMLTGPSVVVYRPHNPLSCGAHCWIATEDPVEWS